MLTDLVLLVALPGQVPAGPEHANEPRHAAQHQWKLVDYTDSMHAPWPSLPPAMPLHMPQARLGCECAQILHACATKAL